MAKNVSLEVSAIFDKLDISTLQSLANIANDQDKIGGLVTLLSMLLIRDQNIIIKGAGAVSSMDTLIDTSNKMSFSRGRMAGYSLVNSVIKNSPRFLDQRLEKEPIKRAKPTQ